MMKYSALIVQILALFISQTLFAAAKPVPNPPELNASSYYLVDVDSGRVLAEKDADKRIEPASITKLMTAYLVDRAIQAGDLSLEEMVTISEKAWRMKGSKMFVEVGKEVSVENLMKGLIIQSGNDASIALAEHIAGTEEAFAGYMNHQAKVLGMNNTRFVNATGWPHENHYSTARDIAILAQAMIEDFPVSYRLYKEREFTFNNIRQYNRNRLLWRDDSVDGVKTGHTEAAGYCLVSSAIREDMRLVSVVLGARTDKSRTKSSQSLLNYGFRFFKTHKLYQKNELLKNARIWYGEQEQISIGVEQDIFITIPRGRYKELVANMEVDSEITAPVKQGHTLGLMKIHLDDELLVEEPLVAIQAVNEGSLIDWALDSIKLMFK
jgi:serine-type D-Ala-D-Ala carboxypeptidase (penicillin-binding protein 5/6)